MPGFRNRLRDAFKWLAGLILFFVVGAYLLGGRAHFFSAIRGIMVPFGRLLLGLIALQLLVVGITKFAIRRGWTSEEKLRRESETLAKMRARTSPAGLIMVFFAFVPTIGILLWFSNSIPGQPGHMRLDMARVESAYPLMIGTEVLALFLVIGLGVRWVHSKLGRVLHVAFSMAVSSLFFITFWFGRKEPAVILVAWAVTVAMLPSLYLFALFQHALKLRIERESPAA